jgi:hypothetical protein
VKSSTLSRAVERGIAAARENLFPALFLQGILAILIATYFLWPKSAVILYELSQWKARGGIYFSFAATGFAGGILSEICKVLFAQRGRWTCANVEDGVFNFLLLGFAGSVVHVFYDYQAFWFGDRLAWSVVLRKTLVDMGLFTPFWATPYQSIFWLWKNKGYSWTGVSRELRTVYFSEHYLPVLMMQWVFWIPVVMMTYSLPLALQFPFFLAAVAIWGLLLATLTKSGVKKKEVLSQKHWNNQDLRGMECQVKDQK